MRMPITAEMGRVACLLVLLLVTVGAAPSGGGGGRPNGRRTLTNSLEDDDTDNASTLDDLMPPRIDPEGSWLSFVRHSDRNSGKRHKGGKSRHRKQPNTLPDHKCEPGPPGPAGPPGPPGAVVTEEVLLREFRELVKEEAAKTAGRPPDVCTGCSQNKNATWRMVDVDEVNVIPRVAAGFHHRLRGNVVIQGKTFIEIKNFHRPFGGGAFQRGGVFSASEGRFTAPRDAIYQLTANLHIAHEGFRGRRNRKLRKRDTVRVMICIMSLCQKHTSLEFISGLETNSKKFTVAINGLLHLESGHYASIFVDNSSNRPLTILEGSDFSGVLIGV